MTDQSIVQQGLATFEQAMRDRDRYAAQVDALERSMIALETENKMLRDQLRQNEIKAGFHMRHSVELTTHLQDINKIIMDALEKARLGAYRNNGSPPSEQPKEIDPQPVPTFLTGPRKAETEGLRALENELKVP